MASDAKELSGGDGKLAQHNEPSPEEYKVQCYSIVAMVKDLNA